MSTTHAYPPCPHCGGAGETKFLYRKYEGNYTRTENYEYYMVKCPACNGSGIKWYHDEMVNK